MRESGRGHPPPPPAIVSGHLLTLSLTVLSVHECLAICCSLCSDSIYLHNIVFEMIYIAILICQ